MGTYRVSFSTPGGREMRTFTDSRKALDYFSQRERENGRQGGVNGTVVLYDANGHALLVSPTRAESAR